ncbi:PREDICTED: increased DNA methylation 1 [Prunus dulcis]|uniref:PREDICTED: increased DNA methylation 1 n=1 Tax=Prunus dulcis TaxID=3755 RepID=A0A5E4E818_PRUDU|nr:hypothetical protein L3X38_007229 [Prunus dulcis]VVA11933.1 PREDICTED: increased DNA methylation 1 [Prunus dulcis]
MKMKRKREPVSFLTVEPQCCPEAVQLWGNANNTRRQQSNLTEKARKHLSAMGWKFWYTLLKHGKTELRYESPTGKLYNSLRTACKAYMQSQGGGGGFSESIGSNSVGCYSSKVTPQPSMKRLQKRKVDESFKLDDQSPKPKRRKILADLKRLRDQKKANSQQDDISTVCQNVDQSDDICTVCHYGGELILCDKCPSAFHTSCLGLKELADGDWLCPSCCCGMCGHGKFEEGSSEKPKDDMDNSMLICNQCEHKYHIGCLKNAGVVKLKWDSKGNWFCSRNCEDIFLSLNEILGKPILVGPDNLTWTLLKPSSSHSDMEDFTENYRKLNLALSVMHECFEPSRDPYTERDIVEDIIFNRESELSRLNFKRFYTVVLERDEELISVATVRIYMEVAEVPLVATRFHYRRLGMCGILMKELEKQLMKMGVGRLTLPSAPSALHTWTTSFGFSKMKADERLQFLSYTLLDFQGTIMCHKLLRHSDTGGSTSANSTVTQAEDKQLETGALDHDHKFLIDDVDSMLLDIKDPGFLSWHMGLG